MLVPHGPRRESASVRCDGRMGPRSPSQVEAADSWRVSDWGDCVETQPRATEQTSRRGSDPARDGKGGHDQLQVGFLQGAMACTRVWTRPHRQTRALPLKRAQLPPSRLPQPAVEVDALRTRRRKTAQLQLLVEGIRAAEPQAKAPAAAASGGWKTASGGGRSGGAGGWGGSGGFRPPRGRQKCKVGEARAALF